MFSRRVFENLGGATEKRLSPAAVDVLGVTTRFFFPILTGN